jgi:hypothetical protein
MAEQRKTEAPEGTEHDEHTHEVAGFLIGERNIPTSAVVVFSIIFFVALVAWAPMWGY